MRRPGFFRRARSRAGAFVEPVDLRASVTIDADERLERADLTIYWPDYAGRIATTLADARRVTFVEGSTVVLSIETNKPLASAELIDEQGRSIAGTAAAGVETSISIAIQPQQSSKLRLRLRDARGRENRDAPLFVFDVVPNRRPEEIEAA